jgi:hypothetical protein
MSMVSMSMEDTRQRDRLVVGAREFKQAAHISTCPADGEPMKRCKVYSAEAGACLEVGVYMCSISMSCGPTRSLCFAPGRPTSTQCVIELADAERIN